MYPNLLFTIVRKSYTPDGRADFAACGIVPFFSYISQFNHYLLLLLFYNKSSLEVSQKKICLSSRHDSFFFIDIKLIISPTINSFLVCFNWVFRSSCISYTFKKNLNDS